MYGISKYGRLSGENQPVILLNSLPEKYKEVKSAIKYGRDSLALDIVLDSLQSKELEMKTEKKESEALFTKSKLGKNQYHKIQKHQNKYEKKGNGKDKDKLTCNYCHKEGHLKYDCPILKQKGKLPIKGEIRLQQIF